MILWPILNARIHSGDLMVTLELWSVYSLSTWVHTLRPHLSLILNMLYTLTTTKVFNNQQKTYVFPKSYLYTYDFRVIYTYGPKGLTGSYLHICIPSNRLDVSTPDPRSSGLPNFPSGGTCFPTVKNAFLEGDLEEQVYMVQPLVF